MTTNHNEELCATLHLFSERHDSAPRPWTESIVESYASVYKEMARAGWRPMTLDYDLPVTREEALAYGRSRLRQDEEMCPCIYGSPNGRTLREFALLLEAAQLLVYGDEDKRALKLVKMAAAGLVAQIKQYK